MVFIDNKNNHDSNIKMRFGHLIPIFAPIARLKESNQLIYRTDSENSFGFSF